MLEKLDMGKYAYYVWMSYGATFLVIAVEIFLIRRKQRTIRQQIARTQHLNKLQEQSNESTT
jgi:heme exporter protein CcmD